MSGVAPKHGHEEKSGWYLRYVKAESFGAFAQTTLGPLRPGLNIVHGANEAGKTTFANLMEGVMFGWEDGRSAKNTYKPENAERSGSLLFARKGNSAEKQARLSRVKNADGVQGDCWLLDDIDRKTYEDIFSLNSDQLLGMADAGQVTSRLLTASAGTATPPTMAREELSGRIAQYTSRSNKYPHSIALLARQRDELAKSIEEELKRADALRGEEAELVQMDEERKKLQQGLSDANVRIEKLNQAMVTIEQLNDRSDYLRECLSDAQRQQSALKNSEDYSDVPARLMNLGTEQDAALCERIAALEQESQSALQKVNETRRDYESALRGYEQILAASGGSVLGDSVLESSVSEGNASAGSASASNASARSALAGNASARSALAGSVSVRSASEAESSENSASENGSAENGSSDDASPKDGALGAGSEESTSKEGRSFGKTVMFALVAILFAALGIFLGVSGSSSSTTLIAALFTGAIIFAVLAVGSAIWSMSADDEGNLDSVSNAKWMMDRERSRYESAQKKWEEMNRSVVSQLEGMGLARAQGDLHSARALLEKARAARVQRDFKVQTSAKTEERIAELRAALEENSQKLDAQKAACGIETDCGMDAIEFAIGEAERERERLTEESEKLNVHVGQLKQRLEAARGDHDLDELRMQHQQVLTRLVDSQRELAELLLAQKMLDDAMGVWQGSYQPEVYREAGRLLSRMTSGRWCHVKMDEDGKLLVADAVGAAFEPYLLSTATCQQLYLSLRIALLSTATLVGANVPVICDDILVNFDEKRRRAAARALARLARNRQVIIFTCHKDIVSTLRWADFGCNVIEL